MINLEIDGKAVEVKEGSMVMDAANQLGIYVPHFCYHKKLTIAANCRMCLVDVERAPKPMPACATPVTAGMIVRTASPKAVQAQKGVMEFLLINHPLDCPICDQGGECQLQDLAVGYGGSNSRYAEEKRVVFEKDVGPLISMKEMTRCIHCTRCVRFGQEIAGVMEFGMVNRGEHSEITTFVGKTVDSELSGNMIDVCPVGALTSKPFRYAARTWELSRRKSVSPHDGLGTNLIVQVKNGTVMRVLPLENEAINECWITDKDRFSYEGLNVADRLTAPMIRTDGAWREVDWPEALEFVSAGIKRIVDVDGPAQLGALASPHSTLEELHLLQKLMRGLGSDNVDTRLRQSDFGATSVGAPWLGMSIEQFATLDRVLVVGSFLRKDQPLLTQRLRQATKRGALLSIIHATDDDLLMPVANKIIAAPSRWLAALTGVAAAVGNDDASGGEAARGIAQSFSSGSAKAILLGSAVVRHPDFAKIFAAAEALATATGASLGFLTEAANSVGAHVVKAHPVTNGLNAQAMLTQPRRGYLLLGVEPALDTANPVATAAALEQAELVVALTAFRSAADAHADVMLPIAPFTETSGTFVNTEGRAQSFNGSVKPRGQTRPAWKILRVLGNLLGLEGFDYESSEAVRTEITGGATDLASRCGPDQSVATSLAAVLREPTPAAEAGSFERVADVPIYAADPLVRRSAPLQATRDAAPPHVRLNGRSLAALGLVTGDVVEVTMPASIPAQHQDCRLPVQFDERVADGCVAIATAHPSTACLPALFGGVRIVKVADASAQSAAADRSQRGACMIDWLNVNGQATLGVVWSLVWNLLKIVCVVGPLILCVAYLTLWERKVIGWMHLRLGPNRVGPLGLLQPFADVLKLLLKEIIVPANASRGLFYVGPLMAIMPSVAAWAVIPFGPDSAVGNVNAGLLYIMAITSVEVYGIIIAGWASNSKYAFLGAMRASAQMVSYEIAMGFALVVVLMVSGSMNLSDIVAGQQRGHFASWGINFLSWNWLPLLPMLVVYFVSGVAETNRHPFDVVEGESEIVAGHMVEYSGMGFAMFFLAEYMNMILISALAAIMFFGGWSAPLSFGLVGMETPQWIVSSMAFWGWLWLFGKTVFLVTFFIWFRATFPRYRYDQIMRLGWKVFIPLSLAWLMIVGLWMQTPWNIWN